jgi:alanyl-tRNA synthetase
MSTARLYHDDPWMLSFRGRVTEHASFGGARTVVLDRTAFYPESGGQMADRGVLGGLSVTDVQVDDEGAVHHVVDGALPPLGAEIEGSIDRARRRVHMALHTGQHMLSRALLDVAGLATVSSRLGESVCTIDAEGPHEDERRIAEAEELVNAVIDDDVPVRAFFPTPEELAGLTLRRAPKVSQGVRVVDVQGFDVSPCGGTHCTRSAQVGLVHVTGLERYKGKLRVSFAAGRRARADLAADRAALVALARRLTCGPADVGVALDKLRRELDAARDSAGKFRSRLAGAEAAALAARALADGSPYAVATYDDAGVDFLRAVAGNVTEHEGLVALLAARGEDGTSVLVARHARAALDCGAFLKRVASLAGGRGGGKPDRAEGRLPSAVDWGSLVRDALDGAS